MKRKASLAQELAAAAPRARKRWEFPKRALADIAECREVNEAGASYISASALARALKARYNLPATVGTIRQRLADMHGGKW